MLTVRQLEATDDLATFDSGNEALDAWVKRNGLKNQHQFGVTYVALIDGAIVGYVTVAASSIPRNQLRGQGPETWPVLLLGRMAVVKDRQGQKLGEQLLKFVFGLAAQQHLTIGCAAVIVDSKPESLGFYQKYMFKPTRVIEGSHPSGQTKMYLPMQTVLTAIEPEVIAEV